MPRTGQRNGVEYTYTAAEEAARDAEEAAWAADEYNRKIENLRRERDSLIADTDYLALSDQPAMTQAMIDYRQALRDATSGLITVADVDAYTFPTKP